MSIPRINKSSLAFLKKLDKNNNREWFKANKIEYDDARANVAEVAEAIRLGLCASDLISTPSGAKSLYRVYRDVRFSKDKTPYTTWYSGYFRRATQHLRGGYYFRISPGDNLVGGGFWGPNKDDMIHIRQQIALDDEPLRSVIESKSFKKCFGELGGNQLKTAPKGWSREHPSIDLLRYKQYLLEVSLKDKDVLSIDYVSRVVEVYETMRPFLDVMSMYLTTDLNGESLIEN